jgi:branched-chain amino acid transport system permease protein
MSTSRATRKSTMPQWLKVALQIGLVGGVVVVIIALEGMIQAFNTRDIIGSVVAMSQALLLIVFLGTAYIAIIRSKLTDFRRLLVVAVVVGLVSSALLVALILLGQVLDLGNVFINATPALYDLLTFKLGLAAGSIVLLVVGGVSGAAAAIIHALPTRWRRSVIWGLVAVFAFGLLRDLIVTTFGGLTFLTGLLFLPNGLSVPGAITLFVIFVALDYFWSQRGAQIRSGIGARKPVRSGLLIAGIIVLLLLPQILGLYFSEVLDNVGLYLLMGLGLNIVVGFAGLLDLGYVAFFAIGAYTVGVLTSPDFGHASILTSWWFALPFGVIAAFLAGTILGIPVLKMRGDYLAIVTLGFGEIIRLLALSDFLKPFIGGAQGVNDILKPTIGPIQISNPPEFYYLILAGCLLVAFVAIRVKDSRLGRAWMAMREDEDVAQAMGINLVTTKLMAFALGASFGGLSGAIFGSKLTSIYPQSFNFFVSINVLSLIIIGGMGSIPGVVVGAIALVGLPEMLREFSDYRYLFYGLALVVMMLTRPEGLVPAATVKRELHEEEPQPETLGEAATAMPK